MPPPITSGLLGEYACADASGTNLPDSSGNANHGTLGNGAGSFLPTITARGLSFATLGQQAFCPAAVAQAVKTLYVAIRPTAWQSASLRSFVGWGGDGLSVRADGRIGYTSDGNGTAYYQDSRPIDGTAQGTGFTVVALDLDPAGSGRIGLNGSEVASYWRAGLSSFTWPSHAATTKLKLGWNSSTGAELAGEIAYLLAYSTTHTTAEWATTQSYIATALASRSITLGVGRSSSPLAVVLGTSLAMGVGAGANGPYPSQIGALLKNTYSIINYGINGASTTGALTNTGTQLDALLPFDVSGRSILVADVGTNDAWSGAAMTALTTWIAARKAAGWKRFVLVSGLPRSTDTGTTNTNRAAWRTSLLNLCDGSTIFLADVGSDPQMGINGAGSNTTYFSDGTHCTDLGYQIYARYVAQAVNSMGLNPITGGGFSRGRAAGGI